MKTRLAALVAIVVAMACSAAILPVRGGTPTAAGPSFGDPAAAPPPPHAIGFPSRDRDLDALPGFASPPAGYGGGGVLPVAWRSADERAADMATGPVRLRPRADRAGRLVAVTVWPVTPAVRGIARRSASPPPKTSSRSGAWAYPRRSGAVPQGYLQESPRASSYTKVAKRIAFTLVYTGGRKRAIFVPREAENPLGASANAVFGVVW